MELTHASFFSGVGGLDLGLERAGWRTVSFSEIDPYASAVLAERWPGVPNLGDILAVREGDSDGGGLPRSEHHRGRPTNAGGESDERPSDVRVDWRAATLWSGGFPCQDLSVAGKRAGFAGARSSLAFAFLDLVERHRPPAILLENVPGLLSSHGGRDFGRLLAEVGNLGYWWAYRILDAQFFGVPQRRRRVFICALNAERGFGPDSAAAVLSVGARCDGHSATRDEAGEGASGVLADGARSTRTVQSAFGHHGWTLGAQDVDGGYLQLSTSPDPGGVREADGLARGVDDRDDVAHSLTTRSAAEEDGTGRGVPLIASTLRVGPQRPQDGGPGDTVPIIVSALDAKPGGAGPDDNEAQAGQLVQGGGVMDSDLLPLGLDSHRYRACGNGVVSLVSEWIGVRIARAVQGDGVQS